MTLAAAICVPPVPLSVFPSAYALCVMDVGFLQLMLFDAKGDTPLLRGSKKEPFVATSLWNPTPEKRTVHDVLEEFKRAVLRFGAPNIEYLATEGFCAMQDSAKALASLHELGCEPLHSLTKEREHRLWAEGIRALHRVENFCFLEIGAKTTILSVIRENERPVFLELPIGSLTTYLDHVQNVVPDLAETRSLLESLSYECSKIELPNVSGLPLFGINQGVKDIVQTIRRIGEAPSGSFDVTRHMVKTLLKPTDTARRLMQLQLLNDLPGRVHLFYPETAILFTLLSFLDCHAIRLAEEGMAEGFLIRQRFGFGGE